MKNILNKIGENVILSLAFTGINYISANSAFAQDNKKDFDYDGWDTKEEWFRDAFTKDYIFLKRMNKDSKYFISGIDKDRSYAERIGLSRFKYILKAKFTEEEFGKVDENENEVIDSKEFLNLRKLRLKNQ